MKGKGSCLEISCMVIGATLIGAPLGIAIAKYWYEILIDLGWFGL